MSALRWSPRRRGRLSLLIAAALLALGPSGTALPTEIGPPGPTGSPQEQWLRQVLAAGSAKCTVAITHHARFSSALAHGSEVDLQPFWQALYESGADLVISGHDHVYERFAPLGPAGVPDPLFGLRQIVVGTGGRDYRNFGVPVAGSEVRIAATSGVLKLTLHADSYDWEFIPEAGKTSTDQGTTSCHDAPPPPPPLPTVTGPAPN